MLPYDIGLKEGSDPEVTEEQRREDKLNELADREHEAIRRQADNSTTAHSSHPSSSQASAPPAMRSPDPDPLGDGPTPAPLLGSLHSSNTAANNSQTGSTASITANSADSIQH